MRDDPISDTHTHAFPTREVGRRVIHALPHPGEDGMLADGRVIADGPRAEVRGDPHVGEIGLGA